MASTFSTNLALELIGTGDQAGTWGNTTNTNLGTLLEQAISGYVTQAVATGTDTTITIPNGSTGVARNMYIELTGTGGSNTNLVVPANKKLYFIFNNSTGAVTVKVSAQTGVSVPTGKKMVLVSNGTDIVNGINYIADFATNSFTVTNLTASSATITNLIATSGSITNLVSSDASATVLRAGSATITNLLATSLAVSSIATFAAGSAAAPAITTTGDTNTGIFFPAADSIGFTGGGVEAARFDSSGNLGLNVSAPQSVLNNFSASARGIAIQNAYPTIVLSDTANATYNFFLSTDSGEAYLWNRANGPLILATNNTERLRLDSSGKLGLGTTSPLGKLTISYPAGANAPTTVTAANTYLQLGSAEFGASNNGKFMIGFGYTDALVNTNSPAYIGYEEVSTSGDTFGNLTFYTRSVTTDTAPNKRMTLDSSGNLGIGASSPATRLDVVGLSSDTSNNFKQLVVRNDLDSDRIYMGAVASAVGSYIQNNAFYDNSFEFKPNDAASEGIHFQDGAIWFSTNSGLTPAVNFTPTERARITAAGELVVGSNTSAYTSASRGVIEVNGSSSSLYGFRTGGTARGYLLHGGTDLTISNDANGPMVFLTNATERARILSGGNFVVGGTSAVEGGLFVTSFNAAAVPGVVIADTSATTTANMVFFHKSGAVRGSIQTTASATAYNTSSDRRLKDNIFPADNAGAVIDAIEVVKHDWKVGGHTRYGMIAQDLHMVAPEAVSVGDDGEELKTPWGVDYSKLVPMLVKEIQSLRARVAQLESK